MEKSQKQITILTKGGKEVTVKFRKLFDWDDKTLKELVMTDLKMMFRHNEHHGDDTIDFEPYMTIFKYLHGHPYENDYTNLFEEVTDEEFDELDEGFNYKGTPYADLFDYMTVWLYDNYPETSNAAFELVENWYYKVATTPEELDLLLDSELDMIRWDLLENPKIQKLALEIFKSTKPENRRTWDNIRVKKGLKLPKGIDAETCAEYWEVKQRLETLKEETDGEGK